MLGDPPEQRESALLTGETGILLVACSLCTGGVGTALFAAACLDGDARCPVLEFS